MAKMRDLLRSPVTTVLLFVLAAGLLLTGGIGTARAALPYISDFYTSGVEMFDIGVTLTENGSPVSWRNYNTDTAARSYEARWSADSVELLGALPEEITIGRAYPEAISVTNSGRIDQYVRVTVYRYWERQNAAGAWEKDPSVDPKYIDIHFTNLTSEGGPWRLDGNSSTEERTVLYYTQRLDAGTPASAPCTDTLTISGALTANAKATTTEKIETRDGHPCRVVTTTYDMDGIRFVLEASVDAVQDHNAAAAIRSAWGIEPGSYGINIQD